jgi:hypothetical protein
MPVRNKKSTKGVYAPIHEEEVIGAVNLEFLPDEMRDKVYRTFDRYFSLGLLPQRPYVDEELPAFPNAMATLQSDEVGDYLGRFTAWYTYTADKKKYLAVAYNVVSNELDIIYRTSLATMTTKANLEIKKAEARTGTDYLVVEEYLQEVSNLMDMIDIELSKLDKAVATLSREISRRERTSGM